MYLHIGSNYLIFTKEIICIVDERILPKNLLPKKRVNISDKEPKSAVITNDCIYLSPIALFTLIKRLKVKRK